MNKNYIGMRLFKGNIISAHGGFLTAFGETCFKNQVEDF
jgi:hypothetical protein